MDELERVINGLECCFNVQSGWKDAVWVCPACPYAKNDGKPCETLAPLLDDALALLKAQQPRLLTVDDFKNNADVDICGYLPCWVEPNPYNDAATEKPGWGLVSVGQIGGVYHRYWTGKPTQEQMEAMKWDG